MASNLRVDTILPSTGTTLGIGTASGTINFLGNSNITTTGTINAASASITGNLGVGGTLTYEDVTNIDSVGLITARSGVNVSGGEVKVGTAVTVSSGGVITSGIVTATSFSGSGANLTGISADYVKLQQASGASGGSALIFDNLDVSTYKFFDLVAFLRPATDAQQLRFYYREGGASGSNITGNSYAYGFNEKKESNTSNCTAGSPDTYMRITGSIGNHASEGVGVSMRISVAQSGDNATAKWLANFVSWNAVYREQGNAARMTNGQGHLYDDTKYPTGFSLYFQSGNILHYSYTLYGIKG